MKKNILKITGVLTLIVAIFAISTAFTGKETSNKISIPMIFVEGGTFWMGAQSIDTNGQNFDPYAHDDEKPVHQVTLSSYYIGKYEVTQAQWRAVMGTNPSEFKGDSLPVEKVSWDDIQKFISKLNTITGLTYRLPTEAEWEYAAKGGNKSKGYRWSGSNSFFEVAWFYESADSKTHSVGTKLPNELGIYDMSGNVSEWCQDWYGNYSSSSQIDPKGPTEGSSLVTRGGNWYYIVTDCRSASRSSRTPPDKRSNRIGFRLVTTK